MQIVMTTVPLVCLMPNGKPYDACPVCNGPAELGYIVADREIRWYSSKPSARNRVLVRADHGDVGLYTFYCESCGWMTFYCPQHVMAGLEEARVKLLTIRTVDFANGRPVYHEVTDRGLLRPPGA